MRRLFIVGAKIAGLLCLFWAIAATLEFIFYIGTLLIIVQNVLSWSSQVLLPAISIIAYLVLSVCFSIFLLFKTEWLANKFKLDKDGDLPNWPKLNTLLNFGIILTGLCILAYAIPSLGKSASTMFGMFYLIRGRVNIFTYSTLPLFMPFIADIFKVGIGLIFVFMPGRLTSFTERWQKKFEYKLTQA